MSDEQGNSYYDGPEPLADTVAVQNSNETE